jgi:hypothetical protein
MLSVIIVIVILLSAISVIMLSVIMVIVILLSAIRLSIICHYAKSYYSDRHYCECH